MGTPQPPQKAALVLGVLSAFPDLLTASAQRAADFFKPVLMASAVIDFDFTHYYDADMGAPIKRQFFLYEKLITPDSLAEIKIVTNQIEAEFAQSGKHRVPRPVNLDPGYLTDSKLVLATTKDYAHRIYLRGGIYAEVTLIYHDGEYAPMPWTYPDYRSEAYRAFFREARAACRRLLPQSP